jgi:penicillin-binding protein 1C
MNAGGRGSAARRLRGAGRTGVRRSLFAVPAALSIFVLAFLAPRITPLPPWLALPGPAASVEILDRNGGRIGASVRSFVPVRLADCDPLLVRATLAAEDGRFYHHPGVDPLALARALYRSARSGRPLGGASTITMQTVRLIRGRPVGLCSRVEEVAWTLVLEAHRSKDRILESFLNRAPYGGGTTGAGAGAYRWFDKPPAALSIQEAALLAAIPRAPTRLDPKRHAGAARAARNAVIARMARRGWITPSEARSSIESPLELAGRWKPSDTDAPHFADWVRRSRGERDLPSSPGIEGDKSGAGEPARIVTTIDPEIQRAAHRSLAERVSALAGRGIRGGAAVVLDTRDGSILALVGSPDIDSPDAGQVNAALSPRQPGSAVKPFTYAVAFAHGLRPSTILSDVPVSYEGPNGIFSPRNYAGGFAGPVSARLALANSWNVPAVEVLRRVSAREVARGFESVGIRIRDAERLGLGLTLGAGEVSLLDLAAAYATLARGGTWIAPRPTLDSPIVSRPALDPIACSWVNEILSDPAARAAAFGRGGPLERPGTGAKTGTSSDWRDAWAFLFTPLHTVAVWMGNPDGAPSDQVTGVEGPAVAARAILDAIEAEGDEGAAGAVRFSVQSGIEKRPVCPLSGCAAGPACGTVDWSGFLSSDPPLASCEIHVERTIDVTTGLLARACTPDAHRRRKSYVRLPGRLAFWQNDRAIESVPDHATPCVCGLPTCRVLDGKKAPIRSKDEPLAIIRPIDGTVVALDPTLGADQQALALEASAPAGARIVWKIDGRAEGETTNGNRIFWPPTPGTHKIEASLAGIPRISTSTRVRVLAGGSKYPIPESADIPGE